MEARLATSPSGVPSAVLLYGTGGTAKVRVDESRADDAAGAAVATMSRSGAGVRIGQNDGALVPFGDDAWMLVWVDGATSVSVRSVSSGVSSADLLAFGETLR
jgi:hypothetical protein